MPSLEFTAVARPYVVEYVISDGTESWKSHAEQATWPGRCRAELEALISLSLSMEILHKV